MLNPKYLSTNFKLIGIIGGVLAFSVINLFYHKNLKIGSAPWDWTGGKMNGFSSKKHPDEYATPIKGDYFENIVLPISIGVQVPVKTSVVKVKFRYRCVTQCDSLWVDIPVKPNQAPINLLLKHQLIDSLKYPNVNDVNSTLFQKHPIYKTPKEFLDSLPLLNKTILTDGALTNYFPKLAGSKFLDDTFDKNIEPDYIFTTYKKPRIFPDGWIEFSRDISLNGVDIDANQTFLIYLVGGPGEVKIDLTKQTAESK